MEKKINSKIQKIASKEDAPLWMLYNEHLSEGYRVNFKTKRSLLKSICMKHNEITHIWSHLIGSVIFIILMIGLIHERQYHNKIYKQIQDDFHKFHLERFNEQFIGDIANFIKEIRNQTQQQHHDLHMTKLNNKIDAYINHLLDFKRHIGHKKQKHIKNYEQYLQQIKRQKFQDKIQQLKNDNSQEENYYFNEIDKFFKDQKTQIIGQLPRIPDLEYFPIIVYIVSVILCLGFSTVYHIFRPLSKRANDVLYRLDVGGISVLVFGSSFACSYYIYYCYPNLQKFYAILAFSTCFFVFILTYMERFNQKQYVPLKGMMFGALGLGNGLSLGHALYIFKVHEDSHVFDSIFVGTIIMGILYLTGLFFFAKRIPEKLVPKKFDIWLNSHTVFHLFVFFAAIQYYFTLENLYQLRSVHICK